MSDISYFLCQIIVAVVVIVILAWILQHIFNPKKNPVGRKYLEMEDEERKEDKKEMSEEERKFYEEIWKGRKKSER